MRLVGLYKYNSEKHLILLNARLFRNADRKHTTHTLDDKNSRIRVGISAPMRFFAKHTGEAKSLRVTVDK